MDKVLITGASGFIGKRVALYFQSKGHEVLGWDCSLLSQDDPIIHNVNMLDEKAMTKELECFEPNIIVHCAGSADVGKSIKEPICDYEGNVTITHNFLFILHKLGLEKTRFVFLSSAGVYGNPQALPVSEQTPINPLSPYAMHKVMCEEMCKYFAYNYGMNIKVARIFSAYGVGLRKQIFWDMYSKYKKYGRLDMFGTGNESRDYIYVDDVINALYLLANCNSNEIVFNVANGDEITIRKATELFAKHMQIENDKISFNGIIREGDPLNWQADISRIADLGYRKTVQIEDGIKQYCNWVRTL